MANELLVVDTSVIVKWFKKDEEAVDQAEAIKLGFLEGLLQLIGNFT